MDHAEHAGIARQHLDEIAAYVDCAGEIDDAYLTRKATAAQAEAQLAIYGLLVERLPRPATLTETHFAARTGQTRR